MIMVSIQHTNITKAFISTVDEKKYGQNNDQKKVEEISKASHSLIQNENLKKSIVDSKFFTEARNKFVEKKLDEISQKSPKTAEDLRKIYGTQSLASVTLYVRLTLESQNETLIKDGLDCYNGYRTRMIEETKLNLPKPYPSPIVSKTNQDKVSDAIYASSQVKTKPETSEKVLKNIAELELELLNTEKEIKVYIEGDKTRPSTYYISKTWGDRLETLLDKYNDLYNEYLKQIDSAKERKLKYSSESKIMKNDDEKFSKYRTYARNAREIELVLDNLRTSLRNTDITKSSVLIDKAIKNIKPLIQEGSPLERKLQLEDRAYYRNMSYAHSVNPKSKVAYLELMLKISQDKDFLNSNIIKTMEGIDKKSINFGNIDSTSAYNAYKDISLFGKFELYQHFNGNVPTNGEEFGTLLLGMSVMGYDSSAQVLSDHGSNLYGRFDYNGSLLVMQHIGSATNYAESICDYENLDYYINVDVTNAFIESRSMDEFRARKSAGIKGRESGQTVGSPGQGVIDSFSEGTTRAKVTTYLTLIETNENNNGFYIEKPADLFDSNLAFEIRLKNLREAMETTLSQKVNIDVSAPSPQSKVVLLPQDLNAFAFTRFRESSLDALNFNTSEHLDYERTQNYDAEGNKTSDSKSLVSDTRGTFTATGETSSIKGTGTYTYKKTEQKEEVTDRIDSGSYNVEVQNIAGVQGYAKGKFDYNDSMEKREIENYLNSNNTFKNSNIIMYAREAKSVSLDQKGNEQDTGKSSVLELQTYVKTEYGWLHAGTDQLDANVNSVYGQVLTNIKKGNYIEGGASGLLFYGNVDGKVLDKIKAGQSIESDFYGEKEIIFEGAGGGFQVSKYGLGGTYQKSIMGEDKGLVVGAFNGINVKGWGGLYINPPEITQSVSSESVSKLTREDITSRATITKDKQSKSDLLKENKEGIGFREVTFSKLSGNEFMNDAFFQLKDDYKRFFGGALARVVLKNGTYFGGAGVYDQKEERDEKGNKQDEGKGQAYLSNKERTKFITAQIIGKNLNLDAVTSGFMYQKMFNWDLNMEGFVNYKDKDNTTFGAEFNFLKKRITLYTIGGEEQINGSLSENQNHLFSVVGGKFVPFKDTGFSIETYGLIGEHALDIGPGGFANPQYLGEGYGFGLFGGGTTKGYATASIYGARWNEDYSLVVVGSWAQLNEMNNINISGQIELPEINGISSKVPISIDFKSENKGNIFELSGVSQVYLTDSLDLNLGALWTGQFNDKSSANIGILNLGIEKQLSWPYSVEIYNETIMQWINEEERKVFNAKSNLNFRLNIKRSFFLESSFGVEHRENEFENVKTKKTGLDFYLNGGLTF